MRYLTIERRRLFPYHLHRRWGVSFWDKTLTIITPWVLVNAGKWS